VRREHAPHLVVATFVQGEAHALRAEHLEFGGQQRRLLRFQHQRAADEDRRLVAVQGPRQRRLVHLRHPGLGRNDPVQERTIVGEQQQAAGLAIEPAHRRQHRIAQLEARRQQVVDQPALVLARTGHAHRLVQHQEQAGRGIERLAVDADRIVRRMHVEFVIGVQHLAVGIGDAAFAEQRHHLPAAAVAKVGDALEDLHGHVGFAAPVTV
jgi:hypothetical protein